jgi:hypothetical protein
MKTLLVILLLTASTAFAQEDAPAPETAPPPPPPAPCVSDNHRQFDFWVGSWDVTANGQPAGHNEIELVHGDCALSENWVSAGGAFTGSSLNMYDQANDKWHQTWVDVTGTLLELDGAFIDGKMVLKGKRPGPGDATTINRITWTPNEDGSVRQHWETSTDGETWATAFDGLYVKTDAPE